MKRLLSLFDYTGQWSEFYAAAGWDVWTIDIKHDLDVFMLDSAETTLELLQDVDGILAAPPCTKMTVSAAWKWAEWDLDGTTAEHKEFFYQVQRLVDLFEPTCPDFDGDFFWCMENPGRGRIPSLFPEFGKPTMKFQPWEYAGHLDLTDQDHNELDRLRRKDGKGITVEDAKFIMECNAYTKETGLWGNFNTDLVKAPVEPVRGSNGSILLQFGGNKKDTKAIRSKTPRGFAKAFTMANS